MARLATACSPWKWQAARSSTGKVENTRDRRADRQSARLVVEPRQRAIKIDQRRRKLLVVELGAVTIVEPILPVQLVNLQIGEAAQRRTQHADQSQTVVGILHRAQQVDRVDDFFGGVEMAFAFDDVADPVTAKRLQVVVNVGQLAHQDGDVFGLGVDGLAAGIENLRLAQHRLFQPARQAFAFDTPRGFGVGLVVGRDDFSH